MLVYLLKVSLFGCTLCSLFGACGKRNDKGGTSTHQHENSCSIGASLILLNVQKENVLLTVDTAERCNAETSDNYSLKTNSWFY